MLPAGACSFDCAIFRSGKAKLDGNTLACIDESFNAAWTEKGRSKPIGIRLWASSIKRESGSSPEQPPLLYLTQRESILPLVRPVLRRAHREGGLSGHKSGDLPCFLGLHLLWREECSRFIIVRLALVGGARFLCLTLRPNL